MTENERTAAELARKGWPSVEGDYNDLLRHSATVAGGMLPIAVYRKLFDLGAAGGTIVEIGTAHGAATIAMALGAKQGGKPFHIYTVDPFEGEFSSRRQYGSAAQNSEIVKRNLSLFGVADHVTVVAGTSETLVETNPVTAISLLFLDADGRIDRDLAILYDRLSPLCTIGVDDYDGKVCIIDVNATRALDQKHRITRLLSDAFVAHGLLLPNVTIEKTAFFTKGKAVDAQARIRDAALPMYRELVFCDVGGLFDSSGRRYFATVAPSPSVKSILASKAPFLRPVYRMIKALLKRVRCRFGLRTKPSPGG
jgi:predicted O-methyltransferase YrrM